MRLCALCARSSIQNPKFKIQNFSSHPSYPRNQRFNSLPLFLSSLPFIHQPSSINLSPSPNSKSKSKILFLLPLRLCALCARQSSLLSSCVLVQRFKPLPLQSKIQNPKSKIPSLLLCLQSCVFSHHPSYPSYQRFKPLPLLSSSLAFFSCTLCLVSCSLLSC